MKGLGFLPTVAKVGQVRVCQDAMLGRLGCVGHSLTPYTLLAISATIEVWLGLKTWQGNAHTRHTRACSLLEISLVLLLGLVFPWGTCVDDSPSSLGLGALGLGTTLGLLACLAPT